MRNPDTTEPFVEHGIGWSKVHYCDGDRPTEQDRKDLEDAVKAMTAPTKMARAQNAALTADGGKPCDTARATAPSSRLSRTGE